MARLTLYLKGNDGASMGTIVVTEGTHDEE